VTRLGGIRITDYAVQRWRTPFRAGPERMRRVRRNAPNNSKNSTSSDVSYKNSRKRFKPSSRQLTRCESK